MLPERRALHRLQDDLAKLNQQLDRQDPMPSLRFDLRGRCAGQAFPQSWSIRLNSTLLHRHGDEFIEQTVPHELAHLVAFAQFGRQIRPHGKEWKLIMGLLGQEPSVCHNYTVAPARVVSRHAWHCPCQQHALSSIRHRRALAGQTYQCRHCGQALKQGDGLQSAC